MKALVDGDLLVYIIGYSTDNDSVEIAFSRLDSFVTNIILDTKVTDYVIYLSDSSDNSFRHKLYAPYKANRVQPKPVHYNELREYLIVKHNAKIAHGMEADDKLGIEQEEEKTIICSIDKDLNQIPGLHYSWPIIRKEKVVREGKIFEVAEEEGLQYFWKQMLIGDTTDNITCIYGIGEKKASAIIEDTPIEKLYQVVSEKYQIQFGEDWKEPFILNSKLLWIKRIEEDELTPAEIGLRQEEQT